MSNWLEGEYVHVPSGTTVYRLDPEGSVRSFKHISKPVALMFLGEAKLFPYYRVFYLGGTYLVDRQYVYKLGEENG